MQKVIKIITAVIGIICLIIFSLTAVLYFYLPSSFTFSKNNYSKNLHLKTISIKEASNNIAVAANSSQKSNIVSQENTKGNLMLANIIPIKEVDINFSEEVLLVPGGTPFGIKLFTEGVMVVKIEDIILDNKRYNPAKSADIQVGDMIIKADSKELNENEDLLDIVKECNGKEINILLKRDGKEINTKLKPISTNGSSDYKIGIWVRDSSAGIGTVTFYEPNSKGFAGLGHGICDIDTGSIMPLSEGEIVNATIDSVTAAQKGKAGTLNGHHDGLGISGYVISNKDTGVYGYLNNSPNNLDAIPLGYKQEVNVGKAQIITTLDDNKTEYYDIDIESINYDDSSKTKNLVIKITDEKLLSKTNGIVQGMSGSPIIQNGKLIGAVTHVFVNEPNKGYGIFAENMLLDFDKENRNISNPAA